jgi:type I restriction enzyme S subunit
MGKYQSYKPSGVEWVEEIPEHWKKSKLKYDVILTMGQSPESENYNDEQNGIPFLQGNTEFGLEFPINTKWTTQVTKTSKIGDILYSVRGSLGEINISDKEYCIGRGLCSIRPKNLNTKLCFYILNFLKEEIKSLGVGSTFLSITTDDLKNLNYHLPSHSEQDQIVQFLDEKTELIDKLISTKERKITLLKEQRTSLINEIVTKGLNPNVKMKDSGVEWIGEIPEHWLLISLHKLLQTNRLEFQDGNHGGEHPNPDEFIENGVPFIKPRDIQNGKVDWSDCDRLPFERCSRFRIGFSNNDDVLLVNRGGSIGKVCYVSDYNNEFPYFVINPQVTYLRGKNGLSSKYVFYITKSDVFRCGVDLVLGHGSTFPFLGLSNMGDFQMVLPPQIEQVEIVKYLDIQTKEIDDLVSLEQKKIDLLKEYRQSLISEVVTGKIKVTISE